MNEFRIMSLDELRLQMIHLVQDLERQEDERDEIDLIHVDERVFEIIV